jgi:AAA+ superfamily predicted ATPase
VAAHLKAPIYAICEADEKGRQPAKDERTGALALFQKLVGRAEKALLLFDEAEDVLQGESALSRMFGSGGRDIGSRAFFYRLLENTPVPVLWTANAVDGLGDAILRRMTYALEIRIPPTAVRARLWRRSADRMALPLSDAEITGLAQDFETAPALGEMAVTAAKLAGGDVRDIRRSLTSVARLMSRGIVTAPRGEERYDPRLINADHDLVGIAECLQEAGAEQPFSMCLSGPPGTGKSAYAAYLAERLGLPILRKRGSDLFGMYVGETEKNIAQAFAEAEATGALLLFDEADSFLSSRQLAHRSWEVSQVNEMLTWMEHHPLPFICTTNLVERLDEAAARRFLIKAHFDYLDADQRAEAFVRFFDVEAPMGLDSLTRLTPADFALVRRKAQFLGASVDPMMLLRLLRHENTLKSKTIGAKNIEPATTKYGT